MDPDGSTKSVYQVVTANIDADTSKCYRHGLHAIEVRMYAKHCHFLNVGIITNIYSRFDTNVKYNLLLKYV